MSKDQLKAFISQAQVDSSLQDQLKAEGADVVSIAKAAGFLITTEDLNAHRQNLSDEELEGVAGGGGPSLSASSLRGSSRDFDP
ncbi:MULTISPECIES: Nif11-like leader peptide family natural product precursor [Prochlorococcus]|uniref:Nif11-like leader peptide family natural product precursor n=1 Tax=Prochlorococcus TaxID=1218 RepID=UPI0009410369|nr:Nif11-like leader peptide family natural product precursor [Prochlorococcus marinus]NMO83101.1 Nif11-like leader peptide family natural product precursor [Prochlorococcus sp. P1344]NMP05186.1 Nif11-like leader peptide family natural product precursor [Prochlorococcus sp. P1361]NMP12561.1 Nif11-like leader peptide family natural product precursor [Prochlorococcus sp.P1363]